MAQKGFAQIIFVLGVLIVSGLIIGGSFYAKNNIFFKRTVNSISNIPTQTKTSQSSYNSDLTGSWEIFIDEYKSYLLKYPSEIYTRLSCPGYRNEFVLVKRNMTDGKEAVELPKCDRKPDFHLSTSNYLTYETDSKPISIEDIIIDGIKAKRSNFPEHIQVSMELNKINYNFYFYDMENKKLFDQILSTFKFLDQTKLKNDAKRLDDLALMQTAINVSAQVAPLSTPIVDTLCKGANPHRYPCSGSSTENIKSTNGDGWIKIDLTAQKAVSVEELPLDPINNNTYHYIYCANDDLWEINTILESPQHVEKMKNDGGDDENRYEVGASLQLIDKKTQCKY